MIWLTLVEMVRRPLLDEKSLDFIFTWHGCRTHSWYLCTIIIFPELVLHNVGCWRTPSSRWSANQMLGTKKKGVGLPLGPAQLNPLRSWCQSQWLGNQKMCGFFLQLSSSYSPAIAALVMISPIHSDDRERFFWWESWIKTELISGCTVGLYCIHGSSNFLCFLVWLSPLTTT